MTKLGKTFGVLLIITIVASCMAVVTVKPAVAQSLPALPTPSVPQFTVRFVNNSYNTQPTTSTQIKDEFIEVTIKNQAFTPYTINYFGNNPTVDLYYNVRSKGHFSDEWTVVDTNEKADYSTQNTVIRLYENNVPSPAKIDFEVQTKIGFLVNQYDPTVGLPPPGFPPVNFVINGTVSDWSNIQTISVPDGATSTLPSPNPTASPSPSPMPLNSVLIQLACQSTASYPNFEVTITGSLTTQGTAVQSAPIYLSYSVDGGNTWNQLTSVLTDGSGNFEALWKPSATGNYLVNAEWSGNSDFARSSVIVNFVLAPFQEKNLFSVSSNSTITALVFNSETHELSFSTNGTSGTTGYVKVYIPKSLVSDISNLKVYLDGTQLSPSTQSQGDSWMVSFTYHQSTHQVAINLGSVSVASGGNPLEEWIIIGAVVVAAFAAIAVFFMVTRKKGQTTNP